MKTKKACIWILMTALMVSLLAGCGGKLAGTVAVGKVAHHRPLWYHKRVTQRPFAGCGVQTFTSAIGNTGEKQAWAFI